MFTCLCCQLNQQAHFSKVQLIHMFTIHVLAHSLLGFRAQQFDTLVSLVSFSQFLKVVITMIEVKTVVRSSC